MTRAVTNVLAPLAARRNQVALAQWDVPAQEPESLSTHIATNEVDAKRVQARGCLIQVTDCFDLRLKDNRIIRVCIEPVAIPVWLQGRLLLKNAPHGAQKSAPQCLVGWLVFSALGESND